jgi:hypothetical protein
MKRGNKKAVSAIVATVILIAIVMAMGVIIWTVVNRMVSTQLEGAENCFGNYGLLTLNSRYTCYNSTSKQLQFSINRGDVELSGIIVAIALPSSSNSYTLTGTSTNVSRFFYNYTRGNFVKMPDINSGLTYRANVTEIPDAISIAPIVGTKQCDITDSISNIDDCKSLA